MSSRLIVDYKRRRAIKPKLIFTYVLMFIHLSHSMTLSEIWGDFKPLAQKRNNYARLVESTMTNHRNLYEPLCKTRVSSRPFGNDDGYNYYPSHYLEIKCENLTNAIFVPEQHLIDHNNTGICSNLRYQRASNLIRLQCIQRYHVVPYLKLRASDSSTSTMRLQVEYAVVPFGCECKNRMGES